MKVPISANIKDDIIYIHSNGNVTSNELPLKPFILIDKDKYNPESQSGKIETWTKVPGEITKDYIKIETNSIQELDKIRELLKEHSKSIYHNNYLEQLFISNEDYFNKFPNTNPLRILYFDIEVASKGDGFFPKPIANPILTIGCSLWTYNNNLELEKQNQKLIYNFTEEKKDKDVLESFAKTVKEWNPDIISGYNSEFFDFPYILDRSEMVKADISGIGRNDGPFKSRRGQIIIPGRIHFDIFESNAGVKKDQGLFGIKSRTLKEISRFYQIDIEDVEVPEDIENMYKLWNENKQRLLDYQRDDVYRTEFVGNVYLRNCVTLAETLKVPLSSIINMQSSFIPKIFLARNMYKSGIVCTETNFQRYNSLNGSIVKFQQKDKKELKYEGAVNGLYKSGFFPQVYKLDFAGMYPSCIETWNLGPDTTTLVRKEPYTGKYKFKQDTKYNWYRIPDNNFQCDLIVKVKNNKEGLLKKEITRLATERKRIKKEMNSYDKGTSEYESRNSQQMAIKVIMNCFHPDTEILTSTGIKLLKDVKIGELVWSINPRSFEPELKEVEKTYEYNIVDQDIYNIKHNRFTQSVTEGHKMLGHQNDNFFFEEAKDFTKRKRVQIPSHKDTGIFPVWLDLLDYVDSSNYELIVLHQQDLKKMGREFPKIEFKKAPNVKGGSYILSQWNENVKELCDKNYTVLARHKKSKLCPFVPIRVLTGEFSNFIGLYLSEGSISIKKQHDSRFQFSSDLYKDVIYNHFGSKFNKFISKKMMSSLNLKNVLDSMCEEDRTKNQRQYTISCKNKALFNSYLEMLIRSGRMFTYRVDSGYYHVIDKEKDITLKDTNTTKTKYTGKVYSLTVKDNHTVYAGKNGNLGWIGQSIYGIQGLKPSRYGDLVTAMMVTALCRWTTVEVMRKYKDVLVETDSVARDTPVYVLDKNTNEIDIIPIEDLHSSGKRAKYLGKYQILTRNGWKNINYTKRHKVSKNIHRVEISDGYVDVTSDHSLFDINKNEITPSDIKEKQTRIETTESPSKIKNFIYGGIIENEKFCWLVGFFIAEGLVYDAGKEKRQVSFNSNDLDLMKKVETLANEYFSNLALDTRNIKKPHKFKLHNTLKSSSVYKVQSEYNKLIVDWIKSFCYTKNGNDKKVPTFILNGTKKMKESFLEGLMCSNGYLDSKSKSLSAGARFLWNNLGYKTICTTRKNKPNATTYNKRIPHNSGEFRNIDQNIVHYNNIIRDEDIVYDVSTEDGTFVTAMGDIVLHNTDGLILDKFVSEEDTNKWLDKIVAENFNINDNHMKMEIEHFGAAYFYAKKNYVVQEGSEYLIHGSSLKSSKAAKVVDRAIQLAIQHIFNSKPVEEVISEAYDYSDLKLEDFEERTKLSKEQYEYDDQTSMAMFLAKQMEKKTNQPATKGTQISYYVTKNRIKDKDLQYFYKKKSGNAKYYTFSKYVSSKDELDMRHYDQLVTKSLERFGIKRIVQTDLFLGEQEIKKLDKVP